MDEDFVVNFRLDSAQAISDASKITSEFKLLSGAMRTVGADTAQIDRVARSVTKLADVTRDANKHTKSEAELNAASARTYSNLSTEIDGAIAKRRQEGETASGVIKARMQAEQAAAKQYTSDRDAAYKEQASRERMSAAQQKQYAAEYAAAQKKYDAEREAAYKERASRERMASAQQKQYAAEYAAAQKKYDAEREAAYKERASRERMASAQQKQYAAEYAAAQKKYDADREAAYKEQASRQRAANAATVAGQKEQLATLQKINSINEKRVAAESRIAQTQKRSDNKSAAADWDREFASATKAADANQRLTQSLSTTRYAMYDASSTLRRLSVAMIALPVAVSAVSIAWERDFASVIRTSPPGVRNNAKAVDALRDSFVRLAQDLPVSFADLTEIGTLGGQLGIASDGMEDFTRTVAMLGATTDLSIDVAATALGRFKALLNVPESEFESIASAILKVGVNSVATESQIVAISTQISSMGAFAGLSAYEVIGLAGALASVGAAPEISRGTVTRLFTLISRAVSASGEDLDKFASVAGVSAETFSNAWGADRFGGIFLKFMEGISESGGDAISVLNGLGVTSVRDVPLLLRLANAVDEASKAGALLGQTFRDANSQIGGNEEIVAQFGIMAETTAGKLTKLTGNFEAFLATIGGKSTGAISFLVDGLTGLLQILTSFAQNDALQWVALFTGGLMILTGVLAAIGSVLALGTAGIIGLSQALNYVSISSKGASVNFGTILAQLAATGSLGAKAAASIKILGAAMKALSLIGLALLLPDISKWATGLANSARGVGEFDGALAVLEQNFDRFKSDVDNWGWLADFNRGTVGLFGDFDDYLSAFVTVDEGLAAMVSGGNIEKAKDSLANLMASSGLTFDEILVSMPDTEQALKDVAAGAGITVAALGDIAEEEALLIQRSQQAADALGLTDAAFADFAKNIQTGSSAFVSLDTALSTTKSRFEEWQKAGQLAATGAEDGWEAFGDGATISLATFGEVLGEQITAQQSWAEDIGTIAGRGAGNLASALAKMGPEGAALAAQAVGATAEELMKLEEQAALAGFLASEAFANEFALNTPGMIEAYRAGGIEAVNGLIAASIEQTRTGVPGIVDAYVAEWNAANPGNPIIMPINADSTPAKEAVMEFVDSAGNSIPPIIQITAMTTDAYSKLTEFEKSAAARKPAMNVVAETSTARSQLVDLINWANSQSVTLQIAGGPGGPGGLTRAQGGPIHRAFGGFVSGPGGPTADRIPAMLSDGEYVIKAASVRKYGTGIMDQLNRGVARFAGGGNVGQSYATSRPVSGQSSAMQLGAYEVSLLKKIADRVGVTISASSIADASSSNAIQESRRGSN